jgi:hypothetical protein
MPRVVREQDVREIALRAGNPDAWQTLVNIMVEANVWTFENETGTGVT